MVALSDDGLAALWSLYDASGIRPEYMIPMLYLESGFDPTLANRAGAPYYGIAQTMGAHLTALGTTPAAFMAMSQGDQIRLAVSPYFKRAVASYGPLRSATRVYLANYLPARLATARSLSQIVEPGGTVYYKGNEVLDPLHHHAIALSDLALLMARAVKQPEAKAAIARAYALRPAAAPPREAVYGDDFVDPFAILTGVVLAALAAGAFR